MPELSWLEDCLIDFDAEELIAESRRQISFDNSYEISQLEWPARIMSTATHQIRSNDLYGISWLEWTTTGDGDYIWVNPPGISWDYIKIKKHKSPFKDNSTHKKIIT